MADLDPHVAEALRLTHEGRKEHDLRRRRYDRAYEVYRPAAQRPIPGIEPWQSRLRVPYAMQTINTALVNLVSGIPRISVQPRHPEQVAAAKAMQTVLDWCVQQDHLVDKQPRFVQSGLIYGAAVAKVHWLYRQDTRNIRVWKPDPQNPGALTAVVEPTTLVLKDGPTFEPWNIYHCYWAPGAVDADTAAYIVLQSYLSKDDLLAQQFNPETGKGLYHNVDQLLATGIPDQPRQTSQDRATGMSPQDRVKDKFLIEEIWTDETVTVIGNRQVLLRMQDNPYWHGRKPVVISQVRPDLFEMQGIAETELIDHLQQAQWTLQNMVIDNLHLTVQRGVTYREGGVTDPNQLELRPRFKWPVSDHDDVRPFETQPIASDVFTERQRLLADMQLVTGINPYITGSGINSVDQNTATGVATLQEVASRELRFKAAQIQNQGYQPAFEMWAAMVQQFLDRNIVTKIVDRNGQEQWVEITPQDVAGEFDYMIEGSEKSLAKQQEQAAATALLNVFTPLIQLGKIDPKPLVEKVAAAYDIPNPDSLIVQPQQQAPAAPFTQQPTGGANPMSMQQLVSGRQMNPAVQQAITQR